jgi:hypothetical protein
VLSVNTDWRLRSGSPTNIIDGPDRRPDRTRQEQTGTDRNRQEQTGTERNRQEQTVTTGTDRNKQEQAGRHQTPGITDQADKPMTENADEVKSN